ncbi:MAG: CD225/dispanin family protein [Angustibacter sp.]
MSSRKMPEEYRRILASGEDSDHWRKTLKNSKPERPPRSYLPWSILATIFCCSITGIVAIAYSTQASTFIEAGDDEKAKISADKAFNWCIASLCMMVVTLVVTYFLYQSGTELERLPSGYTLPSWP